jgi:hypothetical protein
MTEFLAQLRDRAQQALRSLDEAREAGDDYCVDIHTSELEAIKRLADEHDLRLPELDAFGKDAA